MNLINKNNFLKYIFGFLNKKLIQELNLLGKILEITNFHLKHNDPLRNNGKKLSLLSNFDRQILIIPYLIIKESIS